MMLQTPTPPVPPVPPPLDPNLFLQTGIPEGVVAIVVFSLIAATVILWPVVRALARRLEGKSIDAALRGEIERLQHRLEEVDSLQVRVAELEERLDFAERVLVRGQETTPETGRLPRP